MAVELWNIRTGQIARVAWTTTPAAYNILRPASGAAPAVQDEPSRRLVAGGAGTIVYTGVDGVDVTLPDCGAGFSWDVQAIALKASSTATNVVVIW